MRSGVVFDIRKFSVHDGPGIRTAVFLKGCPLDCPWCHNPEGRDPRPAILRRAERCILCHACDRACPLGLDPRREAGGPACVACPDFGACARVCPAESLQLVGRRMSVDELMEELRKDRPFYDDSGGGVTFTGGEPLSQPGFLGDVLDACRAEGIHTAVETSGYANQGILLDIASRTDLLLFDLKILDAGKASGILGVDYGSCLENLKAAASAAGRAAASAAGWAATQPATIAAGRASAPIVVRMPFIPGYNDSTAELAAVADFVRAAGPGILGIHLLPYHASARGKYRLWNIDYRLEALEAPGDAAIDAALTVLSAGGVPARRGG